MTINVASSQLTSPSKDMVPSYQLAGTSCNMSDQSLAACLAGQYISRRQQGQDGAQAALPGWLRSAIILSRDWAWLLLCGFDIIHLGREGFKGRALKEHKERRRLVQLAATMSDDDYEHAGPVIKTAEEIAGAQSQRQELQDKMASLKIELGMYIDHQSDGTAVHSPAVILIPHAG